MTLQEALNQFIKNNFGAIIGKAGGSALGNQPQVLASKISSIVTKTWAEISPPINGMFIDVNVDTSMADGNVVVNVCYDHDMALRPSFSPNGFLSNAGSEFYSTRGITDGADLLILLNNGWEYEASRRPYGVWHGVRIPAKTQREAMHFMQATEAALKAELGNGVQVELNSVYK